MHAISVIACISFDVSACLGHSLHQTRMHILLQEGQTYLQYCAELKKEPHPELVPLIHLSAVAVQRAAEQQAVPAAPRPNPAPKQAGNDENNTRPDRVIKMPPDDLYVTIVCNNVTATLHPATCRVRAKGEEMSATHFEQFAGCGSAKKWRASLKLVPGQVPECPEGE
jgi:hypothetical protein